MSFPIPKLQYKNLSLVGTTLIGSGTISAISDTSEILPGMFIQGTGIPTGALVDTVSTTEVTLASGVVATSTNSSIDLTLGFEISFDYPPKEVTGELYDSKVNTSESLSGVRQVSLNYIEATRKLIFSFLSPAIYTQLDSFLTTHGLLGSSFRYFEDKTLTTYTEYELATFKITPKKIAPRSATTYVWEVPLDFRRAL